MKKLALIACALALFAPAAHADLVRTPTKMPTKFIGNWCHSGDSGDTLTRGKCKNGKESDGWMIVRKNGYSAHETECKLLEGSGTRQGSYMAKFWCKGEGDTWIVDYDVARQSG